MVGAALSGQKSRFAKLWPVLLLLPVLVSACSPLQTRIVADRGPLASGGMVAAGHPEATRVGVEILERGGNAFDAAVAVHFALAVAYPGAGNIGGGGFAVYRLLDGDAGALDFRETAPSAAHREMYLDQQGEVVPRLSLDGHLAVGVPGSVDGMVELHRRFGSLPFAALVQPAIDLARAGVVLTGREAEKLNRHRADFLAFNAEIPYVVNPDGAWLAGDRLRHPELAVTLERIRDRGRAGFYAGETAALIVAEMRRGGGILTAADLAGYRAVWREPVVGGYRGYRILSMPPPSSGGIALLQLLKGAETFPVSRWGFNRTPTVHLMVELERRVYADRAKWLGDPDFFPVPVSTLLDADYLRRRMADIDPARKTDSARVAAGRIGSPESAETTHFSIVDGAGNAVAVTTTLNGSFGSRVLVAGAGFFLNNEMDDFSAKPGLPNQFGLIGAEANAIAPGKRMLSSMTPTILDRDGELFMVLGTPGGSTIITTVFQVILNVVDHGMTMQEAVDARRVHHQWLPDAVQVEPEALSAETRFELERMGHSFTDVPVLGKVNAVLVLPGGRQEGAADRTRGDDAAGGAAPAPGWRLDENRRPPAAEDPAP